MVCTRCKKENKDSRWARCEECRAKDRIGSKNRIKKFTDSGICYICRKKHSSRRNICQECVAAKRRRRAENRGRGLCGCGRTAHAGLTRCLRCYEMSTERANKRRLHRISKGLCTCCGKRLSKEGGKYCVECLERNKRTHKNNRIHTKRRYEQLKAAGICVSCGRAKAEKYTKCMSCRVKYSDLTKQ